MIKSYNQFINESLSSNYRYEFDNKSEEVFEFINNYLITEYDLKEYLTSKTTYQLSVYDGDKLIGASIFEVEKPKIHNSYCAVLEQYRNKGINKNILLKLMEYGKNNGCVQFTAYVREDNIQSLKSHMSIGMMVDEGFEGRYPDGDKKLLLYKMLK